MSGLIEGILESRVAPGITHIVLSCENVDGCHPRQFSILIVLTIDTVDLLSEQVFAVFPVFLNYLKNALLSEKSAWRGKNNVHFMIFVAYF